MNMRQANRDYVENQIELGTWARLENGHYRRMSGEEIIRDNNGNWEIRDDNGEYVNTYRSLNTSIRRVNRNN